MTPDIVTPQEMAKRIAAAEAISELLHALKSPREAARALCAAYVWLLCESRDDSMPPPPEDLEVHLTEWCVSVRERAANVRSEFAKLKGN